MDSNSVITAPQLENAHAIYDVWRKNHVGTFESFYSFMTTPSVARDRFISQLNVTHGFAEGIITTTVI